MLSFTRPVEVLYLPLFYCITDQVVNINVSDIGDFQGQGQGSPWPSASLFQLCYKEVITYVLYMSDTLSGRGVGIRVASCKLGNASSSSFWCNRLVACGIGALLHFQVIHSSRRLVICTGFQVIPSVCNCTVGSLEAIPASFVASIPTREVAAAALDLFSTIL